MRSSSPGRARQRPARRRRRPAVRPLALIAPGLVAALLVAACSSGGSPTSSSAGRGKPVAGGTATIALPSGITYNWIFPFYAITQASVYNDQQFQWLMYRPLYMFGSHAATSTGINSQLSPADLPVFSHGGKTVTVTMKGWKWSDGETVNAQDVAFFLNMAKAEKLNWYAYVSGLLPDNVASYRVTGQDTLTIQLTHPFASTWFTYNQLSELNPMPLAWDVTKLGAKPGSGGCATDSAADHWARCKAVYAFLNSQAKQTSSYATSPLWSVVDGPWKLTSFSTDGHVSMAANKSYSGPVKPRLSAIKFEPFTSDSAEYTALKSGLVNTGYIPSDDLAPKPAHSALPPTDPLGSGFYLEPFESYGITFAQPNFNNPQVGFMVRQLYIRQALQYVMDQPGIIKAIFRGYGETTSGPAPNAPANPWTPAIQQQNGGQGPYPFDIAKAKALLTSHGWAETGGGMTCQDPVRCGTGISKGQQLRLTYVYASGSPSTSEMWQTYKSDASKAGIGVTVQAQAFNTIIGESLPCAPMGPKCNVQVFAYGGWSYDGPGFEPTGEPLFATGAGSNSGNYSNPEMDKLISETHTSNSLAVFDQFATFAAKQLPFIWAPSGPPSAYTINAVTSKLHNVTFSTMYTLLPEYWYYTK